MPKTFRSKEVLVEEISNKIKIHNQNIQALEIKKTDIETTIAKHKKNIADLELKKQKTLEAKPRGGKPKSADKVLLEAVKATGLTMEEILAKLAVTK